MIMYNYPKEYKWSQEEVLRKRMQLVGLKLLRVRILDRDGDRWLTVSFSDPRNKYNSGRTIDDRTFSPFEVTRKAKELADVWLNVS